MKAPGDDGYDFPCGNSHTSADYVSGVQDGKIWFGNNNSYRTVWPDEKEVIELREHFRRQIALIDLWLNNPGMRR